MPELSSPRTIIDQLIKNAEKAADTEIRDTMREAAQSIDYLLRLLKECDQYIDDFKPSPEPPRFIKAVQDALKQ